MMGREGKGSGLQIKEDLLQRRSSLTKGFVQISRNLRLSGILTVLCGLSRNK